MPATVELRTVRDLPELTKTPPPRPEPTLPLVMTSPSRTTLVERTSNTRSLALPLTVVAAAPGCLPAPVIVMGFLRSRSPVSVPDAELSR